MNLRRSAGETEVASQPQSEIFGEYIEHTIKLLKIFRMWELGNGLTRRKAILLTANTTLLLFCNVILGLSELAKIQSAEDLRKAASGIGSFWFHFLGFFKWLYFVWKVRAVMRLVRELEECYNISLGIRDSTEDASKLAEIMGTARKSSVKFTYLWIALLTYGVVHWCMNPIILEWSPASRKANLSFKERPLPYEALIPWDTEGSLGYWCAFLLELMGGLAASVGQICYDSFYVNMVVIVCAQFRYLNHVLASETHRENKLAPYLLRKKLARSKTYHNAILKFLASLEKTTSPVMFVQCVGTMGILCLVSFEAMTMKLKGDIENTIRILSIVEYIAGSFIQLFAFCYFATKVTTLGLRVSDSAYSCGWNQIGSVKETGSFSNTEESDVKAVEFLTYEIITRAQKPVRLTGGPFYVLSLETYSTVVKTAFSFSAVLRELGDE